MSKFTEEKLTSLNKSLEDSLFIKGAAPSIDDATIFEDMKAEKLVPCQTKFPNVWAWYGLMVLYEDKVINSWKVQKDEKKEGKKKKDDKKKDEKKKDDNKEMKKKEDEEYDPFAEETQEDKEKLENMKKKNKEDSKKKKDKKGTARSFILIEVKGWDSEQNLDALAQKIIKEIKMEGLQWKEEYKLADVAFGVKKIILGMVVEDEICSVDDITEKLESWEDDIQSVDIISFNKL